MMVLRVYRITNTVFVKSKLRKNDLIIVVFYGNLTGVRKERRTHEEIKDRGYYIVFSWENGNSLLEESNIRGH